MHEIQAKRFIAGAICPSCHLMDKIVVYTDKDQMVSECVRCGHIQQGKENNTKSTNLASSTKSRKVIWLKNKKKNSGT